MVCKANPLDLFEYNISPLNEGLLKTAEKAFLYCSYIYSVVLWVFMGGNIITDLLFIFVKDYALGIIPAATNEAGIPGGSS